MYGSVNVPGAAATVKRGGAMSAADKLSLETLKELTLQTEMVRTRSGNPVIFSDAAAANVKELVVTLTPTQAGSGDPYPPGGGKNLLPVYDRSSYTDSTTGVTVSIVNGVLRVTGKPTKSGECLFSASAFTLTQDCILSSGNPTTTAYNLFIADSEGKWTTIPSGATYIAIAPGTYTKAGLYLNRENTYDLTLYPMIRLASETDPTFAPSSNVRPISGVSSVSVTRAGRNLLCPKTTEFLDFDGTAVQGYTLVSADFQGVGCVNVEGLSSVFISGDLSAMNSSVFRFCFTSEYPTAGVTTLGSKLVSTNASIAIPSGARWMAWTPALTKEELISTYGEPAFTFRNHVMLNAGTTAEAYAPFAERVTVPLVDSSDNPLTVYGGTLNVTTGELTLTHGFWELTGAESEGWARVWLIDGVTSTYSTGVVVSGTGTLLCNRYKPIPLGGTSGLWECRADSVEPSNAVSFSLEGGYLVLKDTRFSNNLAGLKAELAQNPLQICSPLPAPVTCQLTPAQLAIVAGYNTVYADAGTLSVTYRADPALAYAELESNLTNAILSLGAGV